MKKLIRFRGRRACFSQQISRSCHPLQSPRLARLLPNLRKTGDMPCLSQYNTEEFLQLLFIGQEMVMKGAAKPGLGPQLVSQANWRHEELFGDIPSQSPHGLWVLCLSAEFLSTPEEKVELLSVVTSHFVPRKYSPQDLYHILHCLKTPLLASDIAKEDFSRGSLEPSAWIGFYELNETLMGAEDKAIFLEKFSQHREADHTWIAGKVRYLMADPGLLSSDGFIALYVAVENLVAHGSAAETTRGANPHLQLRQDFVDLEVEPQRSEISYVHVNFKNHVFSFLHQQHPETARVLLRYMTNVMAQLAGSVVPVGEALFIFGELSLNKVEMESHELVKLLWKIASRMPTDRKTTHWGIEFARLVSRLISSGQIPLSQPGTQELQWTAGQLFVEDVMALSRNGASEELQQLVDRDFRLFQDFAHLFRGFGDSILQGMDPRLARASDNVHLK